MAETDRPLSAGHPRLPILDGLRSWVVVVLWAHFGDFGSPAAGDWVQRLCVFIAGLAYVGLDMFFVLSGFLITGILLDTKRSSSYFRTFYARRFLRIVPLYYGFLAVYLLVLPRVAWWDVADFRIPPIQHFAYWAWLSNIAAAVDRSSLPPNTIHLWSLGVEEQFYLVWPAVVYVCSRSQVKRVCRWCLLAAPLVRIALAVTWPGAAYLLLPARLDVLAIGAWMAVVSREPGGLASCPKWAKPVAAIATVVLLALFLHDGRLDSDLRTFQVFGLTASAYLGGSIVALSLAAREAGLWSRAVTSWPLRQIGRYSYGIYILHFPLAYVMDRTGLVRLAWFERVITNDTSAVAAYAVTMIVLSIAAGALSWHLYEAPFLRLGRYVPYDFDTHTHVAETR